MDSKKAQKFEKHNKEIRKKAFLNITIVLLLATGLAMYIGGYAARFMFLYLSADMVVINSSIFVGVLIVIWSVPMLHYREKVVAGSDRDVDYYRERDIEKVPVVQMLEQRGWEEVESSGDEIALETYPTFLHRFVGWKTHLVLEKTDEDHNSEEYLLRTKKDDICRIKTEYQKDGERTEIEETTISCKRVSPVYLEVTMFLEPELEQLMEDVSEEELEIKEEEMDVSVNRYSF